MFPRTRVKWHGLCDWMMGPHSNGQQLCLPDLLEIVLYKQLPLKSFTVSQSTLPVLICHVLSQGSGPKGQTVWQSLWWSSLHLELYCWTKGYPEQSCTHSRYELSSKRGSTMQTLTPWAYWSYQIALSHDVCSPGPTLTVLLPLSTRPSDLSVCPKSNGVRAGASNPPRK